MLSSCGFPWLPYLETTGGHGLREDLHRRILDRKWFYEFTLPDGSTTSSYLPAEVRPIHATRRQMLVELLRDELGDDLGAISCLDLACHEGFFSIELGRRGCRRVLGMDARQEHVDHARWIQEAHALENVEFVRGDARTLDPSALGAFDVTLAFGLLYHLQDVVGVLRKLARLTRRLCVIETQVAPELSGTLEWGARAFEKEIMGCFAIVDESFEVATANREASLDQISLVPSLRGLLWLLQAVGFRATRVLTPPATAYEQFTRSRRFMIAAFSDHPPGRGAERPAHGS